MHRAGVALRSETYDCVVTCFFIDTAPVVFEYIDVIYRVLKPGGFWINLGPLLYHWERAQDEHDERYEQSVELSYLEIRHAIAAKGFKFLKEQTIPCTYAANRLSIMKTVFTSLFFTVQKGSAGSASGGDAAASRG